MEEPVAFVYPHFREGEPVEKEKLFPPLGLAYLKSQLTALSVPSRIHDCTFSEFSHVSKAIERQQPAIVAMYAMITMVGNTKRMVHELRERLPETLFIIGGPLPTLFPRWFSGQFHIVFRGECDLSFAAFCNEYLTRSLSPEDISSLDFPCYPGIYREQGREVIDIPPVHNPQTLLSLLPLPDRSGFDHEQYKSFWMETYGYTQTNIIITRGCPYSCDFCSKPVWGQVYRKPPLDRVLAEVRDILQYGYQRLWIADDSFTLDTRYLREFCDRMIKEEVPVTWTCLSRVDGLSHELVGLMNKAGCVKVYLGLESGDNQTLRIMGKRTTVDDGRRSVSLFVEGGIQVAGFFMVGYPGETIESVEKTLDLALSLPLDEISINVPYPLPGSPLFNRVSGIEEGADWDKANEIRFVYRSAFDEDYLKRRIMETISQFHSRKKKQE
jgi:anaerobic magnesium-protoporphyrin IX monomethyl ester cyclase